VNCSKLHGLIVERFGSQAAFSRASGWHQNKISRMIKGSFKPNTDEVTELAALLKMTESEFCDIFLR
jgi:hypothetical protein